MKLQLKIKKNGLLFLIKGDEEIEVTPKSCFPLERPREFISLIDKKGKEAYIITRLDDAPESISVPLEKYLGQKKFTIRINKILHIEEDYQVRVWQIESEQGKRKFQTSLQVWPIEREDGTYHIQDLSGDIYTIPSKEMLDKKSIEIVSPFID